MTTAPPPAAPPPSPPPPLEPPVWQPPPPPPGPPVRAQLRRSRTDKILGGVSGGLAEYSGIDALLWRVGFVALALAGGTGVVVYLLLWLLMPAGPAAYGPAAEKQAKAPAGPRSPVPGLTIAALLIVVGALALITRFSGWDVGPRVFIGSALLVVGLGLVAAAFTSGRTARGGLIALGIVLSLALITASTLPWNGVRGGVGDRTFRPATEAQVRDVYRGGVGDVTVDLTRLDVSDLGEPVTTRIDHGVGDVEVIVPAVRGRAAARRLRAVGDVRVFDQGAAHGRLLPGRRLPALDRRRRARVRADDPLRLRRRGGVPWLTTASSRRPRPPGRNGRPRTGRRSPRWTPRTARRPAGAPDLGALIPGVIFVVLSIVLMTGVDLPFGLWRDGGFLWVLLIGGGIALLVSELRKARRRR